VSGFSEMGQTWSVPVVTRIPGYTDDDGVPRPVLVFGAGYDSNKDSPGLVTPDAMGRGLFIVDAVSGELVWSITPAADSATNMSEPGLRHSVAATVTVLDSNGDELTDRIYFADTAGQLWRVDLPGFERPDANQDTWFIVRLASVNEGLMTTDRRFFNAPDIVRTSYAGQAFDAILIGSGDRTNPNDADDPNDPNALAVDNQFYMFRDLAINPFFTPRPTDADCNADPPSVDFRCDLPLTPDELYDVTPNLIQSDNSDVRDQAQMDLADAFGWRLDLQFNGEKSLSRSLTIDGKVYFTTFVPATVPANVCEPESGSSRLYVVDLLNATAEEDFDGNGNTDRSWPIGNIMADTPSPHFGSDGEIRLLLPMGSGSGALGSPFLTGASMRRPYGTYWFREEY
jgi:type IV pilus assembly protein PilY1